MWLTQREVQTLYRLPPLVDGVKAFLKGELNREDLAENLTEIEARLKQLESIKEKHYDDECPQCRRFDRFGVYIQRLKPKPRH